MKCDVTSEMYVVYKYTETQRNETHKFSKNKTQTWCHLLYYFTSYVLNMFRTLIYPSSGACDCAVELC